MSANKHLALNLSYEYKDRGKMLLKKKKRFQLKKQNKKQQQLHHQVKELDVNHWLCG